QRSTKTTAPKRYLRRSCVLECTGWPSNCATTPNDGTHKCASLAFDGGPPRFLPWAGSLKLWNLLFLKNIIGRNEAAANPEALAEFVSWHSTRPFNRGMRSRKLESGTAYSHHSHLEEGVTPSLRAFPVQQLVSQSKCG